MARIDLPGFIAAAGLALGIGCGGSHQPPAPTGLSPPGPTGNVSRAPPPELVGVWRYAAVSPNGYIDPVTGKYWNAWGDSISVTFKPDGQIADTGLSTSALYDCHVSILKMFQGTVVVQGDKLEIEFNHNTEHGEGNCPPQSYDKPLPAEADRWTWKIIQQTPPNPPQLLLTDSTTNAEIGRFDFQTGGQ